MDDWARRKNIFRVLFWRLAQESGNANEQEKRRLGRGYRHGGDVFPGDVFEMVKQCAIRLAMYAIRAKGL